MNVTVLLFVVLYEVVVICGVSWFINARNKSKEMSAADFTHASAGLGPITLGATMALTSLGGGHILGLPMTVPSTGMATFWYTISSGAMLCICCCFTGPWYRRLGVTTIATVFEKLFNRRVAIVHLAMVIGCMWAVVTLELQGLATILSALTMWPVTICCVIGGIIGILYIVFAGMQEVAKVNLINAIVMYAGVIIAMFFVAAYVGAHGGWESINQYYTADGNEWFFKLFSDGEHWKTYIIGTVLGQLTFVAINQGGVQQAVAAKSTNSLRKAVPIVVLINCVFSIFMLVLGLVAGSPVAGDFPSYFHMLIGVLPTWLLVIVLAGFAAAELSTIAVCMLCSVTLFVNSVWKPFYNRNMDDKQEVKTMRICIVIFSAVAIVFSTMLPSVNASLIWLFAWMMPAFFMFVFGMFWKRSSSSALITIIVCFIVNTIWTFSGIAEKLNLSGATNAIVIIVFIIIVGVITTAVDKNAKPRLLDIYLKDKKALRQKMRDIESANS